MIGIKVKTDDEYAYVTMNYRHIVEHNWLDDLQYMCEPTEYHEKRITVKWTCDRVTGESFLRHRVFSFARESTRHCDYSRDKFNNELTYIIPSWLNEEELASYGPYHTVVRSKTPESIFIASLNNAEQDYKSLINMGWKAQQARQVLPFCIKSPLIMTGFRSDWDHFFELRCAKNAHPDAQKLANELKDIIDGSEEVR